jgi:hypothetical protein
MLSRKLAAALLAGLALVIVQSTASATLHEYIEDFFTRDHCDENNTTADWDTLAGEIRLFPFEPAIVGSLNTSGTAYDVVLAGDHAYVADGYYGLIVMDISDPSVPTLAGDYNTTGQARGVTVEGDYAYVAGDVSGLQIIDITDPANPSQTGACDTPGTAYAVAVAGNHAYVADKDFGLQVVDISNPASPSIVGNYDTSGFAYDVEIAGDHAYVADQNSDLQVIDITDPTNPTLAGHWNMIGAAYGLAIDGDHAFIAHSTHGLRVVDISDPTNPSTLGTCDTPGTASAVWIEGDWAYVADRDGGLQVIDISDPTGPTVVTACATPGQALAVALAGEYAYVAENDVTGSPSGLRVIRIATATSPSIYGGCYPGGIDYFDVAVAGDCVYALQTSYLWAFDISDPGSPTELGSFHSAANLSGMDIAGDCAYVAASSSGLLVIDISDPSNLVLRGSSDEPSLAADVSVSGDYAYVADYSGAALQVIDINDPANPTLAGSCSVPGQPRDLKVVGKHAYVAARGSGLQVIDISNPTTPTGVGSYSTPGAANGLAVQGDRAYVGCYDTGLTVLDISDPTNPTEIGSCDLPGSSIYGVSVSGDWVFAADSFHGLRAIDVEDPTNPIPWGSCELAWPSAVAVAGDHAFIAWFLGLEVATVRGRTYDGDLNVARSSPVVFLMPNADIARVRLTSTQTDLVKWSVMPNLYYPDLAVPVTPGGDWVRTVAPDNEIFWPCWESAHYYAGGGVNPACSWLKLEFMDEYPSIEAVTDIPDDQGGRVRIELMRSSLDFADEPDHPTAQYTVMRLVDGLNLRGIVGGEVGDREADGVTELFGSRVQERNGRLLVEGPVSGGRDDFPPGTWEILGSFGALQQQTYLYEATTLADDTETFFCVVAQTTTPSIWYVSNLVSGVSMDNIAPGVPTGLAVAYLPGSGNELTWDLCPDEDFQYFNVYRSAEPDFTPSPGNLVHSTAETGWVDAAGTGGHYYRITALDHAGNESDPSSPETATGVDEPSFPARFALYQSAPNPLRSGTVIAYDVPRGGGEVSLAVYDVAGRRVRALVEGIQRPGAHNVSWDGRDERGIDVASGVYYCRLNAPGCERTIKITVLR